MADDRVAVLEQRVTDLERDLANLRAAICAAAMSPSDSRLSYIEFRRRIMTRQELIDFDAAINKSLGIEGLEPVGPEKLREMMIADGVDPNSNEFSQGIIAMREE